MSIDALSLPLNWLQLGQRAHPHPTLLSASLPEDSLLWEPLQHRAAWKCWEHKAPSAKARQELVVNLSTLSPKCCLYVVP